MHRFELFSFGFGSDGLGHAWDTLRLNLTFACFAFAFLVLASLFAILISALLDKHQKIPRDEKEPTTKINYKLPNFPSSDSPMFKYSKAAVAHEHGMCSEIGRNVLMRGGNAVDAAIAAEFCSGVLNMHSSGIGGGFFMTLYNRTTRECSIIDARETAPIGATTLLYESGNALRRGFLSIAVPGQIAGLWTAFKEFGSGNIKWRHLLQPTIMLCNEGFPVGKTFATRLKTYRDMLIAEPSLSKILVNPETKDIYKEGDIIKLERFGSFLENLSEVEDPVEFFYNSTMTERLVEEIQYAGGILTMEDFRNYQVKFNRDRPPIKVKLKSDSLEACGPPPPSSSAVVFSVLKTLEKFNVNGENLKGKNSAVEMYHRFIEALKFAQNLRQQMGDMDFAENVLDLTKNMTTEWFAEMVKSKITEKAKNSDYYAIPQMSGSTSTMVVVDSYGNGVSLTSSINYKYTNYSIISNTDN